MNKVTLLLLMSFLLFSGCGGGGSSETQSNLQEELETSNHAIFKKFNVGFGGSVSFPFSSNDNELIWMTNKSLLLDENISYNGYYAGIKDLNVTAFSKLQSHLKKSKFLIFWFAEGWQESWYDTENIQTLMNLGYIPVFSYWYFGDQLLGGMPSKEKQAQYEEDNLRVANFLATLEGEKMLIMEPEFNKIPVLESSATQHEFASIISKAIDIIKAKNPTLLFSLSMMDKGARNVNNKSVACGYENCAYGDKYIWKSSEIVFTDLLDKLDFISFHQMIGEFSRDYTNLGGWNSPNPKKFTDDEVGIDFLAERILNLSTFLHEKYNKPVFIPYIGIMSATWEDTNSNNKIEDNEIHYNQWENKITNTYKRLSELKPTLKANGLFGFAPMALFDNPRQDYGGYQYFMNNEYHLGIIGSGATDETDKASYGDLYFKGNNVLEYIFDNNGF